jgi:histidinol-phosphate aminotransferase
VWQLWTPNKAMGLTGVRGAYAIAPHHALTHARAVETWAPSWPLGAHAVALLEAWVSSTVQDWLANSLETLRQWKHAQRALLEDLGWRLLPSEANYLCGEPPSPLDAVALRAFGIKLRDTTSFGLPGHWRLGVLPPQAQATLHMALQEQERVA